MVIRQFGIIEGGVAQSDAFSAQSFDGGSKRIRVCTRCIKAGKIVKA